MEWTRVFRGDGLHTSSMNPAHLLLLLLYLHLSSCEVSDSVVMETLLRRHFKDYKNTGKSLKDVIST